MIGPGYPLSWLCLISILKLSARGRPQRMHEVSWPQKRDVKTRQVSACNPKAHSCRLVGFNLLHHREAPTDRLLYSDASVLYVYLINCKPLTNASGIAFEPGASISSFISSLDFLTQLGAAETSTSSLALTGSFIPLCLFVLLRIGYSILKVRNSVCFLANLPKSRRQKVAASFTGVF